LPVRFIASKISLIVPKPETLSAEVNESTAASDTLMSLQSSSNNVSTAAAAGADSNTVEKKKKKKAAAVTVPVTGLVQRGPLLLTRQGMSGPAVLKLSAFGARIMNTASYKYVIYFTLHIMMIRSHY